MGNLKLTSSAFSNGGEIPRECGYKNGNKAPPLTISGIPEGTKSLTLIMDDPDAMEPAGKVWVHWVVWSIDPINTPPEDPENNFGMDAEEGLTDFGEAKYGGPAPPDKRHTYVFKLYALDTKLDLTHGPYNFRSRHRIKKPVIEKAMEGHIIEQTQLTGTYAP